MSRDSGRCEHLAYSARGWSLRFNGLIWAICSLRSSKLRRHLSSATSNSERQKSLRSPRSALRTPHGSCMNSRQVTFFHIALGCASGSNIFIASCQSHRTVTAVSRHATNRSVQTILFHTFPCDTVANRVSAVLCLHEWCRQLRAISLTERSNTRCTTCDNIQHATCSKTCQHVACCMLHAACNMWQHTTCSMQHATCNI